jgi:hypothetical protein
LEKINQRVEEENLEYQFTEMGRSREEGLALLSESGALDNGSNDSNQNNPNSQDNDQNNDPVSENNPNSQDIDPVNENKRSREDEDSDDEGHISKK